MGRTNSWAHSDSNYYNSYFWHMEFVNKIKKLRGILFTVGVYIFFIKEMHTSSSIVYDFIAQTKV